MTEPTIGDAFGESLLAHVAGAGRTAHFVERDDGFLESGPPALYFAEPEDWLPVEAGAVAASRGEVLDIGAGAGRFALALQAEGHAVVALDTSPGAVEVCRHRGVEETFLGTVFDLADSTERRFDTMLLMGHNLGLIQSAAHAPRFLDALRRLSRPGARIVGTGRMLATDDPSHLRYHERNRSAGRLPGQLRLRVRFREMATDWFDYLIVDPDDLDTMAQPTGWSVTEVTTVDVDYLAVLEGAP